MTFSVYICFFFFKQKTAYEMRISDWSSDVCSSDLKWLGKQKHPKTRESTELVTLALSRLARSDRDKSADYIERHWAHAIPKSDLQWVWEIGRASCRERVCQYV